MTSCQLSHHNSIVYWLSILLEDTGLIYLDHLHLHETNNETSPPRVNQKLAGPSQPYDILCRCSSAADHRLSVTKILVLRNSAFLEDQPPHLLLTPRQHHDTAKEWTGSVISAIKRFSNYNIMSS